MQTNELSGGVESRHAASRLPSATRTESAVELNHSGGSVPPAQLVSLPIVFAGGPRDGETAQAPACFEIRNGEHGGAEAVFHRYTRTLDRVGGRIVFAYAGEERVSTEPIGIAAVLRWLRRVYEVEA